MLVFILSHPASRLTFLAVYTLAQELAPGRFRPTITHSFIKLLTDKDLLLACFTQNIDTLERRAGVPRMRIVEAHGSFASQRCINCKYPYPDDLMARHIAEKTIPYCTRTQVCKGLVKPDIVFFGEPLPVVRNAYRGGVEHEALTLACVRRTSPIALS